MSNPTRTLIKEVARLMDTSNVYANRMVNAVIVGVLKELLENKKCSLLNFGYFYLHIRKSYPAPFDKNFIIPPKTQLSFRPSRSVKNLLNPKEKGQESEEENGIEDKKSE